MSTAEIPNMVIPYRPNRCSACWRSRLSAAMPVASRPIRIGATVASTTALTAGMQL